MFSVVFVVFFAMIGVWLRWRTGSVHHDGMDDAPPDLGAPTMLEVAGLAPKFAK